MGREPTRAQRSTTHTATGSIGAQRCCGAVMRTYTCPRSTTLSTSAPHTQMRLLMAPSRHPFSAYRMCSSLCVTPLILIFIDCIIIIGPPGIIPLAAAAPSFRHDCSDQVHKEIACSVHIVECDEELVPQVDDSWPLPAAAHDIRVEPFARAMPRRSQQKYQLSVDISWQMPPNNSTSSLKAFLLEISAEAGTNGSRSCFLFNVTDSEWTTEVITSSPRFHFSTESIFEFGLVYDVILTSLPKSNSSQNSAAKHVTMPRHPELNKTSSDPSFDCSKYSNPQASKWTAGFRRIFVHSLARTIQIEFVGAPAHYCFEAYEVRLKDETGLDLLHSSIIPVEAMHSEVIDNNTVLFGEYNFTDLEVERDYVPSVIPIERADDGRCLCPVSGNDPFDNRIICSCIAADWKKVRLHRLERPTAPPIVPELNGTVIDATPRKDTDTFWTIVVLSVLVLALLLLSMIVYALYTFYRRYRAHGKTVRIRFVSDRPHSTDALTPSSVSQTPLINISRPNILLVYAHDCAAHEAAVIALAEYLRDVFSFDVHVDVWDSDEIERNLMDYISASILSADKVLVVNSMGAHYRYQNKIQHETRVERKQHTLHDILFETQIDQALMHPCVISVRFTYTPYSMVLPPLSFSLQYILPDNMAPLLTNLNDRNMKSDPRLFTYNAAQVKLNSAVSRMTSLVASDPNWFEQTHHRVPRIVSILPTPVPLAIPNGDTHLAVVSESVHDHLLTIAETNPTQPSIATSKDRLDITQAESETDALLERQFSQVLPSRPDMPTSAELRHDADPIVLFEAENPTAVLLPKPETSDEKLSTGVVKNTEMKPSNGTLERYDDSLCDTLDSGLATKTPLIGDNTQIIGNIRVSEEELPSAKQNGHVNGLMGRFVKGLMSPQSDSGLIADLDGIDVSS